MQDAYGLIGMLVSLVTLLGSLASGIAYLSNRIGKAIDGVADLKTLHGVTTKRIDEHEVLLRSHEVRIVVLEKVKS